MSATAERFSQRAAAYAAARPPYPRAIAVDLKAALHLPDHAVVADLGSGTGLSSEIFLRAGCTVIGVEPNADMRAAADAYLASHAHHRTVAGSAEATGLPDASVDLVIAAQAAHWFDAPRARREALRILRRPAHAALIWNERESTRDAFAQGYEQLLCDFGTDYTQVRARHADPELIGNFFGSAVRETRYPHVLPLDENKLRALLASASYLPAAHTPQYALMMERVHTLYERHQQQGLVQLNYVARVFAGVVSNL